MTVKIDMEMPKGCAKCRFHIAYRGYAHLCLAAQEVFDGAKARKIFCPLQEVKE